jgi:HEAT repeat protein
MLAEGDDGAGELVGLLSDPAPSVRAAAAGALMRFRDPSLWPAVAPLLRDHDPRVRHKAVVLIAACSPEAAGELLVGALNDPDPDVRLEAAGGLRAAPSVEALPELVACLLGDTDWRVRARAVEALSLREEAESVSLFGGEAEIVSALELASADSNPLVRAEAEEGLEAYHRAHAPIIVPLP